MILVAGQVYQVLPKKRFLAHWAENDLKNEEIFIALTGPIDRMFWHLFEDRPTDRYVYLIFYNFKVIIIMHDRDRDLYNRVRLIA